MLYDLSKSDSLWERKIAIMPTFYFTKKYQLAIHCIFSEQLLRDQEDLIHKTVGWMLRDVGKRNLAIEVVRLRIHSTAHNRKVQYSRTVKILK